jgi:hypothetical protein
MVEERLREELIKYDRWLCSPGNWGNKVPSPTECVDEYLKNVKKSLTPICAYLESTGGCIPGCGTDSCMYHPNNR